jgi:carboxypeptidase Taq
MKKQKKAAKENKNYHDLHALSRETAVWQGIQSLLDWDQETYMPSGAASIRGEQMKELAGLLHKRRTDKKFASSLQKLIDIKTGKILQKGLSEPQKSALREWKRDYLIETSLPSKFVEEFAKTTSEAMHVWDAAKKKNDFSLFYPFLDKIVGMCRKKADLIGYKEHPYDALLNLYEPSLTKKGVEKLFHPLKAKTLSLLKKIRSKPQVKDDFLHIPVSHEKQMSFGKKLAYLIGYSSENGRIDIAPHPFSSSSHPSDSRITTRILPKNFMSNIRSVLHECGHAFYEIGLPQEHFGSPLGEAISLGMHESQSRFWETRIGLSKPFWAYLLPFLKKDFGKNLENVSLDTFWKGINKVEPTLIRVEADEVTYAMHVILRFELECALMEGTLKTKEIPEAWNEKMVELLGVMPKKDSEGCLQDVHWSLGAFGYFPTYSLGNMYASHIFEAFEKDFPHWEKTVESGDFQLIKKWLGEKIHCHGRTYSAKSLLEKIAGKPFSAEAFTNYLSKKYQNIYS